MQRNHNDQVYLTTEIFLCAFMKPDVMSQPIEEKGTIERYVDNTLNHESGKKHARNISGRVMNDIFCYTLKAIFKN